jgi:flavin-dependent dehydrogenase
MTLKNNPYYDVIIIGAGFAGLACARSLAQQGVRTLVLEKKPWPATKIHTTGIVVRELADSWNLPARLCKKIHQVRLYGPDMNYLDLHAPDYYFVATDTRAMIRWHAEQTIQSGATLCYGSSYTASEEQDGLHVLDRGRLRCRYLIGCDGARSRVARQYALGRNRNFLMGLEVEVNSIPGLSDSHLHVFLDNDIARGYIAWIVPGVHGAQVGLAVRSPAVPELGRLLAKLSRYWHIDTSVNQGYRAGLIPCGGPVFPFHGNNVLLLGDAAGMVSPLTAGGIHPAVDTGAVAGEFVADYLLHDGEDPGRVLARSLPRYHCKRGLRWLYDHAPFSNTLLNRLFNMRTFRSLAQTVFFHHRGLFSAAAWRDIIRLHLET